MPSLQSKLNEKQDKCAGKNFNFNFKINDKVLVKSLNEDCFLINYKDSFKISSSC